MRHRLFVLGAAALLSAAVQAAPAAATQALRGRVSAQTIGAGVPIANQTDEWFGSFHDVSASSVYNSPTTGIPSAEAHVFTSAHWDSADSGRVDFTDDGISVFRGPRIENDLLATYSGVFEYIFTADRDGVLDWDLRAAFTGSQDNIGVWQVGAAEIGNPDNILIQRADGYAFGSSTLELANAFRLTAGHSYDFVLVNGGDSRNFEIPGTLIGNESGSLAWRITPDAAAAPEPAAWMLMVLGVGSAGAMLRAERRRTRYASR